MTVFELVKLEFHAVSEILSNLSLDQSNGMLKQKGRYY